MAKKPAPKKTKAMTMAGLVLRPERDDDLDFLRQLYATTREEEMALIDWSAQEKDIFLRAQFEAQHSYYLEQYGSSRFDVIEQAGTAIGRLYVARGAADIRIIDIALLPEHRGQGLGAGLLQALLDEAAAGGTCVSIHVEIFNPARHLYERLGFKAKGEDNGVYRLMEWRLS